MTAVLDFDPVAEVEALEREIADMLESVSAPGRSVPALASGRGESVSLPHWLPPVDIVETDDEYLLKVDLPGVRKEDVKVTVDDGVLTIAGERPEEKLAEHTVRHRAECHYGRFERRLEMPDDADPQKISARLENGVLWVRVAKDKNATRAVEVKVK